MKKKELLVAAIENGTVIDHIPSDRLFDVVRLLKIESMTSAVTVGYNLKSQDLGLKSIIKIADKYFTDEELNQLAVVCPNLTLCIIRDYDIVEKHTVHLPEELIGIVKCSNPKCITNNEPMRTRFRSVGSQLVCHYCNHTEDLKNVKLVQEEN
ncbi:MAG: aspartate carbamoyltransferase regulatory subunit [Bacteroidaceae bacterium]|nr:aspartate carbamoyltransferase regulatory subunit [Bacteroidaceae bacterium]